MKSIYKLITLYIATLGMLTQAQTLDSRPANAKIPQALLVAVPTKDGQIGDQGAEAIVVPMKQIDGLKITDAKDLEANKAKIAKEIEKIVTSKEAKADLTKFLASKALAKNESAADLKSREAWYHSYYGYYRPYYNNYWYNPYYYGWGNYAYSSYCYPSYYYGGYSYYYYYPTYSYGYGCYYNHC
jgi:hypothetical protein